MKKKEFKKVILDKNVISNLSLEKIKGGSISGFHICDPPSSADGNCNLACATD